MAPEFQYQYEFECKMSEQCAHLLSLQFMSHNGNDKFCSENEERTTSN